MGDESRDLTAEFERRYGTIDMPAMRRAEVRVIGCDYGATSFTTRPQADRLAAELGLRSGMTLLDLGSGAGWPGLYLAGQTHCRVILADPVTEGLQVAARRIAEQGIDGSVVAASGGAIPLPTDSVDAVTSSDVFC